MEDENKRLFLKSIDTAASDCCEPLKSPEKLDCGTIIKFSVSGNRFMDLWRVIQYYALSSVRNFRAKNSMISIRMPEEDMLSEIKENCYRYLVMHGAGHDFSINFTYIVKNYFYSLRMSAFKVPSKKTIYYCSDIDDITESFDLMKGLNLLEDCTRDIDFWNSIPMKILPIVEKIVLEDEHLSNIAREKHENYNILKDNISRELMGSGIINKETSQNKYAAWKIRLLAESSNNKYKSRYVKFIKRFNIDSDKNIDLIIIPNKNIVELLDKLGISGDYFYRHAYRTRSPNVDGLLAKDRSGVWYSIDNGDWIEIENLIEHKIKGECHV
jgi:hypothetical protein